MSGLSSAFPHPCHLAGPPYEFWLFSFCRSLAKFFVTPENSLNYDPLFRPDSFYGLIKFCREKLRAVDEYKFIALIKGEGRRACRVILPAYKSTIKSTYSLLNIETKNWAERIKLMLEGRLIKSIKTEFCVRIVSQVTQEGWIADPSSGLNMFSRQQFTKSHRKYTRAINSKNVLTEGLRLKVASVMEGLGSVGSIAAEIFWKKKQLALKRKFEKNFQFILPMSASGDFWPRKFSMEVPWF